jgi:MFS transporter, ACS family, hexuronate transporter
MTIDNRRMRWSLMAMLAVSSFLNYVDRQTLSLLAVPVQRDLQIDNVGYANLVTAFLVAYTIGTLITGWVVVKIGARRGLAIFVALWSLACTLGGSAQNAFQLGATRFALGLGETGNWIAAPVIVRQWFPAADRASAIGLYTAAAMIGATVAPPLITGINAHLGWRYAFWLTGSVGLFWVVVWLMLYRRNDETKAMENEAIVSATDTAISGLKWREIFLQPRFWAIVGASMCASPVWYFYLFWFPKYLTDERGVSVLELGRIAWVVYLAAGRLVARGIPTAKARILVMSFVAIAAPVSAANLFAPPVAVSLAIGAFVGFSHFLWTTNITALTVDLFASADLGKVFGSMGLLGGLAGIGSNYLIAFLVGSLSYRPMFVGMGCAYLVALMLVALVLRFPAAAARLSPTA